MEIKAYKSDDPTPQYYLVNRDEKTGELHIRNINGSKMVDSVPFIMTKTNPHYATAAPSKFYDKLTLDFLRLEELEANEL